MHDDSAQPIEPIYSRSHEPYGIKAIRFVQGLFSKLMMGGMAFLVIAGLLLLMVDIEEMEVPVLSDQQEWQSSMVEPWTIVEQSDGDYVVVYAEGDFTALKAKYSLIDRNSWAWCYECGGEWRLHAVEMSADSEVLSEAIIHEWNVDASRYGTFALADSELAFTMWSTGTLPLAESAYSLSNLDSPPEEWNLSLIPGIDGVKDASGRVVWHQPVAFDEIVWMQNEYLADDSGLDSWYLVNATNGSKELLWQDEVSIQIAFEHHYSGEGPWAIVLQSDDYESEDKWCDLSLESDRCYKAPWFEDEKADVHYGKQGEFGWLLADVWGGDECVWMRDNGETWTIDSAWHNDEDDETCLIPRSGKVIIPIWENGSLEVFEAPETEGIWFNSFCWIDSGADCSIRFENSSGGVLVNKNSTDTSLHFLGEDGSLTEFYSHNYRPPEDLTVDEWCFDWRRANDGGACPDRSYWTTIVDPVGEEKWMAYMQWFFLPTLLFGILSSRMNVWIYRSLGYKEESMRCMSCAEFKMRKVKWRERSGGRHVERLHEQVRPCFDCLSKFPEVHSWIKKGILRCNYCQEMFVFDWPHDDYDLGWWAAATTIESPQRDDSISKVCPKCTEKGLGQSSS
jgi:hypothetical protein